VEIISDIWNGVIIRPMINSLVLLYYVFLGNFGLSIIAFTIIIRGAMIPLSLKQSRQMKAMSALAPKMKEIQARYPDDKPRASRETMQLYKEQGVNPLGCLGPMILQMPIFIGLFWALRGTLPSTPERLVDLSRHLYPWLPQVNEAVPLDGTFLWLDLARYSSDNPVPFLLPLLVGGSMWLMQKMSSMPSATPQQESTNRMMLWMMPIMFGFFTLNFESGLALYWIVSNIVGIVIQGFVAGWGPLEKLFSFWQPKEPVQAPALTAPTEEASDAEHRNDRQDRRRGHRDRPKGARRRSQGRRNRRR
jgi:YidC/Oxa1 family membrane protein insertase